MQEKSIILDDAAMRRALMRITHEIIERNKGCENICLCGILRRGVPLAKMLQDNLKAVEGTEVPCGTLDITFYRDDLSTKAEMPVVTEHPLPFSVNGKKVILVDDVLYTGRTARAAIEAIFKLGRPSSIQLAVLVDRGHRELPIRADYVGKNVPTAQTEQIAVHIPPIDTQLTVVLGGL